MSIIRSGSSAPTCRSARQDEPVNHEALTDEEYGVLVAVLHERSDLVPVREPLHLEPGDRERIQDLLLAELSEREIVDGEVTQRGQLIEGIIDKFRPWDE